MTKIKVGNLLRYKKRIFRSNWKQTKITLYKHGTFVIQSPSSSSQTMIRCEKESTLIIFGQQIKSVPKIPVLPSGYQLEQLLAIGLIEENYTTGTTTIIFYWFLTPTLDDLSEWILAFHNSLLRDPIDSADQENNQEQEDTDLAVGLMMAGAAYWNTMTCDTYDTQLDVAGDFQDYSFAHDLSLCAI